MRTDRQADDLSNERLAVRSLAGRFLSSPSSLFLSHPSVAIVWVWSCFLSSLLLLFFSLLLKHTCKQLEKRNRDTQAHTFSHSCSIVTGKPINRNNNVSATQAHSLVKWVGQTNKRHKSMAEREKERQESGEKKRAKVSGETSEGIINYSNLLYAREGNFLRRREAWKLMAEGQRRRNRLISSVRRDTSFRGNTCISINWVLSTQSKGEAHTRTGKEKNTGHICYTNGSN